MLTEDVLNGNPQFEVDKDTIAFEVFQLSKDIEEAENFTPSIRFDPAKHLAFEEKHFKNKTHCPVITDIAAVEPFPLFTEEAIEIMKWEVFLNPSIIREFGRKVNLAEGADSRDFQVSGYANKTTFTKEALSHPKVLLVISSLAGLRLKIPHVYNMAHINASLADRRGIVTPNSCNEEELKEKLAKQNEDADRITSSVHWHYDSVPMVCVLMLEAPENMIGGETCIRNGSEDVVRISGPRKGSACLLQGRVVKHIATKPLNHADRISLVISFVPEDPEIVDTTSALSERPSATPSFLNDKFYPNYVNYKFDRIQQKCRKFRKDLMENCENGRKFDQIRTIEFCKEIEQYLKNIYVNFEAIDDSPYPPRLFSIPYSELNDIRK